MKDDAEIIELYDRLIEIIRSYHPSSDITMINKAYEVAKEAHKFQFRKSGEPFFIHPLNVAIILARLKLDKETIMAALLHDVVEDTDVTYECIEKEFGQEVAFLVDGVTKLTNLTSEMSKAELKLESFKKLTMAMSEDIRVIIIKIADRVHNMKTLNFQNEKKQIEISMETMDLYAPIAKKLGISVLQIELEDLAMMYLYPEEYQCIKTKLEDNKTTRDAFVGRVSNEIHAGLIESGVNGSEIKCAIKHLFSIYRKMVNRKKSLDEIYDMFSVRILVDSVKDCYIALGVLHDLYKPIPGRFKDFISIPKANMYQSLHTTVVSDRGEMFEVQIRTKTMEDVALYGILAHWKYGVPDNDYKNLSKSQKEKSAWLQRIMEWQQDIEDNNEFIDLVKQDLNLFSETIYCFTPNGKAITLPKGSVALDFAYLVHSEVGNSARSCIINGKEKQLEYVLNNGDQVEIITGEKNCGPERFWLDIVKTGTAKNKIRRWFARLDMK